MTTTTKKKSSAKKPAERKAPFSSVKHLTLEGEEYMLVPAEEFKEMMADYMLGVMATEAIAKDDTFIPLEEVKARHAKLRKGRSND